MNNNNNKKKFVTKREWQLTSNFRFTNDILLDIFFQLEALEGEKFGHKIFIKKKEWDVTFFFFFVDNRYIIKKKTAKERNLKNLTLLHENEQRLPHLEVNPSHTTGLLFDCRSTAAAAHKNPSKRNPKQNN